MKRRNFLKNTGLATAGSLLIPGFLKAYEQGSKVFNREKILVIIQWSGGNDGLNTVVPYQNDIYYEKRPNLAIAKDQVLKMEKDLGLNPVLTGLKEIYDQGYLSVINNVGYPNPDRSHFRSLDIWQTGSGSDEYLSTGWLGRYLDAACPHDCQNAHQAIEIDDTLGLALKGDEKTGLALMNAKKFYSLTQDPRIKQITKADPGHGEEENVSYLYKTLAETSSSADYIYDRSKTYASKKRYPTSKFARQLKTIAELINSGVDTRVYYTSLSGFDTHVNQKGQQERLLKMYSDAIKVFVEDLKQSGRLNDTLIMTFSEFGRRVAQNASRGTDHGTANNLFLIGGDLNKAGIYNEGPNLLDLDKGDLKYRVDFREIYATLLKKQLGVEPNKILNASFKPLDVI